MAKSKGMDAKAFVKKYGLNVEGSLYLEDTQITALPDNLTVGGSLDLRGTQITALPDNLTVGGSLYLEDTQITDEDAKRIRSKPIPEDFMLSWQGGKYVSVDGVFSEVVSHKGDIYRTRQIGKERVEYLVTDRKGKWAHGATLEAARADLIYKIGSRDKSVYAELTLDSVLPFEQAIQAYRVITGACSAGTRGFVERLTAVKEQYSISEICELTKGQFGGSDFAQFFAK